MKGGRSFEGRQQSGEAKAQLQSHPLVTASTSTTLSALLRLPPLLTHSLTHSLTLSPLSSTPLLFFTFITSPLHLHSRLTPLLSTTPRDRQDAACSALVSTLALLHAPLVHHALLPLVQLSSSSTYRLLHLLPLSSPSLARSRRRPLFRHLSTTHDMTAAVPPLDVWHEQLAGGGYPLELFVDSDKAVINKGLLCPICLRVCRDAIGTPCCRQVACGSCFDRWKTGAGR